MQRAWRELVEREGLAPKPAGGEATGCPACGSAAPLVEGACADCGLQLA